ncbi:MAG: hypothetical protein D4R44_08155 [Actinobacteria bacterium]|nr:MAG: hypothetical protein D4R44_08155 [Actinomycetota bacterium]
MAFEHRSGVYVDDEQDATSQSSRGTVDYKTLFLGSCLLVSILGGGLWNLWNSKSSEDFVAIRNGYDKHEERLRTLDSQMDKRTSENQQFQKYIDDQEARLRALEHQGDRR